MKRNLIRIGIAVFSLSIAISAKGFNSLHTKKAEYLQKRDEVYLEYAVAKQAIRDSLVDMQENGEKLFVYFTSNDFEQLTTTIENTVDQINSLNEIYDAETEDPNVYQETASLLREYQEFIRGMETAKSEIPNRITLLLLYLTDERDGINDALKRLDDPKIYHKQKDLSVTWT